MLAMSSMSSMSSIVLANQDLGQVHKLRAERLFPKGEPGEGEISIVDAGNVKQAISSSDDATGIVGVHLDASAAAACRCTRAHTDTRATRDERFATLSATESDNVSWPARACNRPVSAHVPLCTRPCPRVHAPPRGLLLSALSLALPPRSINFSFVKNVFCGWYTSRQVGHATSPPGFS